MSVSLAKHVPAPVATMLAVVPVKNTRSAREDAHTADCRLHSNDLRGLALFYKLSLHNAVEIAEYDVKS